LVLPFTRAGFLAEVVGISPRGSGVNGGITTMHYLQRYCLSNKLVETFIENVLTQTVAEVVKTAIVLRKSKAQRGHNRVL